MTPKNDGYNDVSKTKMYTDEDASPAPSDGLL